jgi:chemotaxis protein methyltransferase CheR
MAAAILLAVGLLHLMVWGQLRDRWVHFLFAVTTLCVGVCAIFEACFYGARTIDGFNSAFKLANSFNGVALVALVWFVLVYSSGWRERRVPAVAISSIFLVASVVNLILPYGFLFVRIDELRLISLPWGEQIATAAGPAPPWRLVTDVGLAGILVLVVEADVRLWRRNERRRAMLLGGSITLFAAALLIGSLIDIGVIAMPYPVTWAFLIVGLAMSAELTSEVVTAARLSLAIKGAEEERDRALAETKASLAEVEVLKSRLEEQVVYLMEEIETRGQFKEIIGESDALRYVLRKIEQVAPVDTTVLIEGETGVGKELVARAIHAHSPRKDRPMIAVNMSALPPTLVEAELFGHERGAFTGATRTRKGRFELADGGTLFLDEIAEMPMDVQGRLLRVLQEGEFERIGGERTIRVDVRLIAASNHSLKELVDKGLFREDLYYRLHVYPITVPALRRRRDDIPLLVERFVRQYADAYKRDIQSIPRPVVDELVAYDWPGNIRELQNVIERAVLTTPGNELRLSARLVNGEGHAQEAAESAPAGAARFYRGPLDKVEREYILRTLESRGWRIEGEGGAAVLLGLHPNTLRSRMRKFGIERPTHGSHDSR